MTIRNSGVQRADGVIKGPAIALPAVASVAELIAGQAQAAPNALAVRHGDQALSYSILERRVNQLANHLRARGAGRGARVALLVERSIDLVVATLAVVKTGAAYVPIDPAYPAARVSSMIDDASPSAIVSNSASCGGFLSSTDARVVRLDVEHVAIQRESADAPANGPTASDNVYVVYTSGSTGQPKGVEISHGSLLNLVCWHQHAFCIGAGDRASQVASPAFDAFGWEIFPYLAAGASVHLVDEADRASAESLRDWMLAEAITVGFVPTPIAEAMIRLRWPAHGALRLLLTGADRLRTYPPSDLPFSLVNNYGPTEATVVATSAVVAPTAEAHEPPAIGVPIGNTNVYLLDEGRRPVPAGAEGELYIGGASVAKGYFNRPSLTHERFVPDPFAPTDDARMYRTGDRARLRPDGQIAFLGRTDDQIKIRGFRVEPEEIIGALNGHDGVEASAVAVHEDIPGDPVLVAYVVARPGVQLARGAVLQAVQSRLPDYMVPAAIVHLDRLPLTSSGKVDRRALPAPTPENVLTDSVVHAPRTAVEAQVAGIVAELLRLPAVSVEDNFFYLGGHSLLGTQLIVRIRGTFGVELPLRRIFEAPTVAALSSEVERLLMSRIDAMSEDEIALLLASTTSKADDRGSVS